MTQSNDDSIKDSAAAYIALDVMRNPPVGPKPDWAELQAYREGELDETRRAEVLSHIANDADVHQQWLDLSEADHWLANPQNQTEQNRVAEPSSSGGLLARFAAWFTPVRTTLAGVGAMALAAIAIIPSLLQQTALTAPAQFDLSAERYLAIATVRPEAPRVRPTRSVGLVGPLTNHQIEKSYVLVGFRSVVQKTAKPESASWSIWLDNTPGDFPDCSTATDAAYCSEIAEDAQMLGQWSMLTWFVCNQEITLPAGDSFWKSQSALWKTLRTTHGFAESSEFAKELTTLDGTGSIELCARTDRVMRLARSTN